MIVVTGRPAEVRMLPKAALRADSTSSSRLDKPSSSVSAKL